MTLYVYLMCSSYLKILLKYYSLIYNIITSDYIKEIKRDKVELIKFLLIPIESQKYKGLSITL